MSILPKDMFKDVLGNWIGENKSAKFWLGVLNDLKNRGLQDVLIFNVDGLTGLKKTINAAYLKLQIQRCVIHQPRNSFKYVSYKHLREFANNFKSVYKAINILMQLKVGNQTGMYYLHFSSILRRLEP